MNKIKIKKMYKILGISSKSLQSEIDKSFHEHPLKNENSVQEAYIIVRSCFLYNKGNGIKNVLGHFNYSMECFEP